MLRSAEGVFGGIESADGADSAGGGSLPPVPTLHVRTEDLIEGGAKFEEVMRRTYAFLQLPPMQGPIVLPARVTAPESKAVGKRVAKSRNYKQRKEAELRRRRTMGGADATSRV